MWSGHALPYRLSRGMWKVYRTVFGRSGTLPSVVMNIGVLDEDRLRFGEALPIVGYILGPFGQVPGFGMTISTYRGTSTVWIGAHQKDVDPDVIERVLHGIDEELPEVSPEDEEDEVRSLAGSG